MTIWKDSYPGCPDQIPQLDNWAKEVRDVYLSVLKRKNTIKVIKESTKRMPRGMTYTSVILIYGISFCFTLHVFKDRVEVIMSPNGLSFGDPSFSHKDIYSKEKPKKIRQSAVLLCKQMQLYAVQSLIEG